MNCDYERPIRVRNVRWLLIDLLQERRLPLGTLGEVADTITIDSRASDYSEKFKKLPADEKIRRLDLYDELFDECESIIKTFYEDSELEALNSGLQRIRKQIAELAWPADDNREPNELPPHIARLMRGIRSND